MRAFTGARQISYEQRSVIWDIIGNTFDDDWYVGDATGVDEFIYESAKVLGKKVVYFAAESRKPYHLAIRSKRMVDTYIKDGGKILYAFPVQDCPRECYPGSSSWGGSGTWGTIAYARKKGLAIALCPLANINLPDWYLNYQIPLF